MMTHNFNARPVMDNSMQFFNATLTPLEQKVKQYLDLERDISLLDVELLSLQSIKKDFDPEHEDLEMEIQDGQHTDELNDKEQKFAALLEQLEKLKKELIRMLPEENRFVELHTGFGSQKIGYFTVDPETRRKLTEPVLRVVA